MDTNNNLRILVLADIYDLQWHGHLEGSFDMIISCGDIDDQVILEAANQANCNRIYAVKGNHDTDNIFAKPIQNIHLTVISPFGFKLGGFQGCYKYKAKGNYLYEDSEVNDLIESMPAVDVFVAHNSPCGIYGKQAELHRGFAAFNNYIERKRPNFFLHGHQHINQETWVGNTKVIGIHGVKELLI